MLHNALLGINIQQMQVFFAVAEFRNFSKAGEMLHMTQSAVSKSVARVENLLGFKLFVRNLHGISLTWEGKLLYEEWSPLVQAMNESLLKAYNEPQYTSLTIALDNATAKSRFWPVARAFEETYPEVNLVYESDSAYALHEGVVNGTYDIIMVPWFDQYEFDRQGIPWAAAADGHVVVHYHKDNPLAKQHITSFSQFSNENFTVIQPSLRPGYFQFITTLCAAYGFSPKLANIHTNAFALDSSVLTNKGVIVTDDYFQLHDTTDLCRFEFDHGRVGIIFAWNKNNQNPYIKKLIEINSRINPLPPRD